MGRWTFVYDSQIVDAPWGKVAWKSRVCGDGSIEIKVASSNDGVTFGTPVSVRNGEGFTVPTGRYLQVSALMKRSTKHQSPLLYALTVATAKYQLETPDNLPPQVSAGPNRTLALGYPVRLTGSACDDGAPIATGLDTNWSVLSGPGEVVFSTAKQEVTDAAITIPGTYVLRLSANDSALGNSSDITLNLVRPNYPPAISVSTPMVENMPNVVSLAAVVSDDGLPEGSTLTTTWTKVSGPGTVDFADATRVDTTATFSAEGSYMLRLQASDGQMPMSKDVIVVMNPSAGGNRPPSVQAGPNLFIPSGLSAQLEGACTDDGLPAGGTLACQWTKKSGPGDVTFNDPSFPRSMATFSEEGVYVLELLGSDGELSTKGSLEVGIGIAVSANLPPIVNAGPNRVVSLPNSTSTLPGAVSDDGLPAGQALSIGWSKLSGPGMVSFGTPNLPVTTVQATVAGTYTLRLTASDTQHEVWSDVALVASSAPAENQPPVITMPADLNVVLPERGAKLIPTVVDDGKPGNTLTYAWSHVGGPTGVAFSSTNTANPTVTLPNVVGTYTFKVVVSDSQLTSSATMRVHLKPASSTNRPPVVQVPAPFFVNTPATSIFLNGTVTDDGLPQGVTLTVQWNQLSGPAVVTFADRTQAVTTASFPLPGDYELELIASDLDYMVTANLGVAVRPVVTNQAPSVTIADPGTVALPPGIANLVGSVRDDGLPIHGSLQMAWTRISGPGLVAFSRPNQASTAASFSMEGTYELQLEATDGFLTHYARVTVTVARANSAPSLSAGPNQVLAYPMRIATLAGTVSDDGRPLEGALSTQWSVVSAAGDVSFADASLPTSTVTFGYPGTYVLRLSASDGQLSSHSDVSFEVGVAVGVAPTVVIVSPVDGSRITSPTDIVGSVSGGEWKLEHRLGGDEGDVGPWTAFATGTGTVLATALGRFDSTLLLNGIYGIRLTSTTSEGTASASINVSVERNLKVGNFTISFSDVLIPVAGLPMEVIRTYDSRDKAVGDFGIGWNVGHRNLRVETSATLGRAWHQQLQPGFFPSYCVTQTRPRFVTVSFPTGKVLRFKAKTDPDCEMFTKVGFVELGFDAESGTQGTLTTTSGAGLIATENTLLDGDGRVFDPQSFHLTAQDGMEYSIEKRKGLAWMKDRNGNTITVSPNGIIHSAGKSIVFERDGEGRIVKMTDPKGHALHYTYNLQGELTGVTDREGNRTAYTYNQEHGLLDIVDPRGVRAIRNEYDSDGRLVKTIDANNQATVYSHRLERNEEVITDRTGNSRVLTYDYHGNVTREEDALGGVIRRTFDGNDNRTSEKDALGNETQWKYDVADNLTETTDPLLRKSSTTYNTFSQVLTTTDALGRVTTNGYNNTGNVHTTTDPLGNSTGFGYHRKGYLTSRTNRLGYATTYIHDEEGNVIGETDAAGNVTRYTLDTNGNRLTETRTRTKEDGTQDTLVTRNTYDKNNRLLSTTHPDGSVTGTSYNAAGLRETTTDALGRVTRFTYNDAGQLIQTSYPDGTSTSSTYDYEGRRLTSTDRAGKVTTMEYDRTGRLVKTTHPDGTFTSTAYYLNGWVFSTTDEKNHTTLYEYDPTGRQTKVIDPLGNETTFTYDAVGNQLTVTDARGNTTTSVYDALNRLVTTKFPDTTQRTTTYDKESQRTAETDQAGKSTTFAYDALGRLGSVTDALNQTTYYQYDELGNRILVIDAAGKQTKFAYDKLGRETKRILPDGKFEVKGYNLGGELVSRTDFQARTTTYSYDVGGRLTGKTYPDSTTVGFTYSPTGRRLTAVDARGTTKYSYNDRDRLTTLEYPNGRKLEYGYDAAGNRTSLSAKVGTTTLTTTYTHDILDRIASVTDPDGRVFGMEYDNVGSLAKLARPNGVDTTYTHDGLNRLTNVRTATRATDATIASYAYTLGPTGIRTRIDEADGTVRSYQYDYLYRLTKETVTGGTGPAYEKSFAYDQVSNRMSQVTTGAGAGSVGYSYDLRDRLMSVGTTPYDWTDNGNLMSKAGEASYEWDFEDRLVKVVKGDGTVVENVYDVDGVLVKTVVTPSGGATTVTDLLVDTSGGLSHVVAEVDGTGTVTALYVRAGDMLLEEIRGGAAKLYEADGLGSVRGLLDTTGARTDAYSYEAFGSTVSSTGTDENPYRFAGERYVDKIGMYQNRARWLDTGTGRFVSVDRSPGTRSRPMTQLAYSYAEASPVNKLDPSGNFSDLSSLMGALVVTSVLSTVGCQPNTSLQSGLSAKATPPTGVELASNMYVRGEIEKAWDESMSDDPSLAHEEGGWIYVHPETRTIIVKREWRKENRPWRNILDLRFPPIFSMFYIVADFHTHPFRDEKDGPSDKDISYEKQVGVPGLIRLWTGGIYPGGIMRRENYRGNNGYPNISGGRW